MHARFTSKEENQYYDPSHAIALVLPIALPQVGSGLELYDVFHGEQVPAKILLQKRQQKDFDLINYKLGHATLFCPFQFHSGYCAEKGTLLPTVSRIVLVAFLIKYEKQGQASWHMFRMCKGATLEYDEVKYYGLDQVEPVT